MENKEKKLNYSIQDFFKNKHSKSAWGGGAISYSTSFSANIKSKFCSINSSKEYNNLFRKN